MHKCFKDFNKQATMEAHNDKVKIVWDIVDCYTRVQVLENACC